MTTQEEELLKDIQAEEKLLKHIKAEEELLKHVQLVRDYKKIKLDFFGTAYRLSVKEIVKILETMFVNDDALTVLITCLSQKLEKLEPPAPPAQ